MTALRRLREAVGMTQEKLARKVHMSECELGNVERGYRLPWPHEAKAIADVLVIAVETLFPDGYKMKKEWERRSKGTANYMPPEDPPDPRFPVRRYPPSGEFLCYKCGRILSFRADDHHPQEGDDLFCRCGAAIRDILPLEEARV
jgi:transcriptional regulator with XRE-family HTH domain